MSKQLTEIFEKNGCNDRKAKAQIGIEKFMTDAAKDGLSALEIRSMLLGAIRGLEEDYLDKGV